MSGPTTLYPDGGMGGDMRTAGVYTAQQLDSAYRQMQQPQQKRNDNDDATDSEDFQARVKRMQWAERGYNGNLPKPFKRKPEEQDLNTRANRLGPIVRTGAALLFGAQVQFVVEDEATETLDDASTEGGPGDTLNDIWTANKQAITLNKLALLGGKFGHVFVKVIDDGALYEGRTLPRLVLLDPRRVDVEMDPDDADEVRAYNYYWLSTMKGPDGKYRPVLRRQRWERQDDRDENSPDPDPLGAPEHWITYNQYSTNQIEQITIDGGTARTWQDLTPPVDWPYTWGPIHHCQNLPNTSRFFGQEDITPDLIESQQELNFSESMIKAIKYYLGYPILWGRGFGADQMKRSPDNVILIESETGVLNVIPLNGDVAQHMAHAESIRLDMEEMSGLPAWMLGRMKEFVRGDMPGITLRTSAQAAINKTMLKRELYGDMLNALNSHLLEMAGEGEGLDCDIIWQDILPANEKEWAAVAPVAEQMGMSKKAGLAKLGLDYEQERQQRLLEAQDEAEDAAALAALQPAPALMPGMMGDMMGAPGDVTQLASETNNNPNTPTSSTQDGLVTTSVQDSTIKPNSNGSVFGAGKTGNTASGLNHPAMQQARQQAMRSAASRAASVKVKAPSSGGRARSTKGR